jgi:cell division protein FtsL
MTRKQVLLVCVMLLLLMGSGISHVWSNFEMTQKGYDISQLKNEEMKLMDINRKLRLELAILKSPQNIESLANKLGLKQPSPEQIIVLR